MGSLGPPAARVTLFSRSSARVQDLQVVRVVHDAHDVPERIYHGGGDEPLFAAGRDRQMLPRSHRQQPLEGRWYILDVPVHDGTSRTARRTFGRVAAIDQAQLVLVVAEAKLDISRPRPVVAWVSGRDDPTVEFGAFEVRVDAQKL